MVYQLIKSFHIIGIVAWFAGLFYLPRLFVYHAMSSDKISLDRFKIMEKRLYYQIMYPAAVFTTVLGMGLLFLIPEYGKALWMQVKLILVGMLWVYHLSCGHYLREFSQDKNKKTANFYRLFNEYPTILLISMVILVVIKPF